MREQQEQQGQQQQQQQVVVVVVEEHVDWQGRWASPRVSHGEGTHVALLQ